MEVLKGDADEGRREMNERANNLRDREVLEVIKFGLIQEFTRSTEVPEIQDVKGSNT